MKNQDLLDYILGNVRLIIEDREKLQKLCDFIRDEIEDDDDEIEEIEIPEKYKAVVHEAAGELDADMVCFINPDTLELVAVPTGMFDGTFEDDGSFEEELDRVYEQWEKNVRIEPPSSNMSYEFMERFIDEVVSDNRLKNKLTDAIGRKRPFANFRNIIDDSPLREKWFAFKQKCLEEYVYEELGIED